MMERNVQLCEIAFIFGQISRDITLVRKDRFYGIDMEEMFEEYEFILKCWEKGIDIHSEEEDGYISSYADRFIRDYYFEAKDF